MLTEKRSRWARPGAEGPTPSNATRRSAFRERKLARDIYLPCPTAEKDATLEEAIARLEHDFEPGSAPAPAARRVSRRQIGYDITMDDGTEGDGHARTGAPHRLANRVDLPLPERIFDTSPPVVEAMSSLFDDAIDRLLSTPLRVTSAIEGKRLLAGDDGAEAVADHVQRVVVLAVPVLRTFLRGARLTRVPWVLVATTAFSIGSAVRSGIHEAQVICSLVAHRLEQETGRPADPALVKSLALELYLDPKSAPDVSGRTLPLGRVLRRWVVKGALGRDTRKRARKALDAAERLDLRPYLEPRPAVGH